jgi:hypothetical protein
MTFLTCARCSLDIKLPEDGRLPPWCPHCGVDYKVASGEQQKAAMEAMASPLQERAPVAPIGRFTRTPLASPTLEAFTPAEPSAPGANIPASPRSASAPYTPGSPNSDPDVEPEPVFEPSAALAGSCTSPLFPPSAPVGWGQVNLGALGLAALFLLACLYLSNSSIDKVTTYRTVPGKVVELAVGRKGRVYPRVAYWVGGKEYRIEGSSSGSYLVGESVEVLVSPAQPDQATLNYFSDLWLGPILTGVLGAGCLLTGLMGRRATG